MSKKNGRVIRGVIKAQVSSTYGPTELNGDDKMALRCLTFMDGDMSEHGYSVVGTAEVKVTLFDEDKMVSTKVESLRAEAKKVKADAAARVTNIERKINQLLAITNGMAT